MRQKRARSWTPRPFRSPISGLLGMWLSVYISGDHTHSSRSSTHSRGTEESATSRVRGGAVAGTRPLAAVCSNAAALAEKTLSGSICLPWHGADGADKTEKKQTVRRKNSKKELSRQHTGSTQVPKEAQPATDL